MSDFVALNEAQPESEAAPFTPERYGQFGKRVPPHATPSNQPSSIQPVIAV